MAQSEPQGCLAAILRLFGIRFGKPDHRDGFLAANNITPALPPHRSRDEFVSPEKDHSQLDDDDLELAALSGPLPYALRDDFLSPAEFSFFRVLRLVVKDQAIICAKVNLADIFFVVRPNENQTYRNKIDRKHVDFLLCDPKTMKPLAGLELDDSSHKRANRVERDVFVDEVFEVASLPLIRIPARTAYDPNALAAQLAPHLQSLKVDTAQALVAAIVAPSSPVCPKCAVPMVRRVAKKGQNAGQSFFGCPNYPRCREIT